MEESIAVNYKLCFPKKIFWLLSNIVFYFINNASECCPRCIQCDVQVPTLWAVRPQWGCFSNTLYRLTTLAAIAPPDITHPPPFPNCRDCIQSICMLIIWPNFIKTLNDLANGSIVSWVWLEFQWSLNLNKQQWVTGFNSERNCKVDSFSRTWNGPLGGNIVAIGKGEPIAQNWIVKVVKICFNPLIVVVQLGGDEYNVWWVVATMKTNN